MSQTFGRVELARALGFDLSEAQWAAVSAPLEPAVIVAGAGTGKTTSMSARVAYLVGSGQVRADRVLGLTFTNKAAGQLLTSIRSNLAAVAGIYPVAIDATGMSDYMPEPTVMTYHGFAGSLVREYGLRIGREPDATLLVDGLKHLHAYRLVCGADSLGTELSSLGKQPATITENMLDLDGELSELGIEPEALIEHDRRLIERVDELGAERGTGKQIRDAAIQRITLARLIVEWRGYKARRDLWEYSDYLRLAREIVVRFPETAAEIRNRYEVVLLDEYQDTSITQRVLLQSIFGAGFPVTAVGDPCQAIYGWRGASVDNIDSFPGHFPSRDGSPAKRYSLAQNRRSGPAVLDVANSIAAQLREAHSGTEPLVADQGSEPASVAVGLFDTIHHEVEYVAYSVKQAHEAAEGRRAAGIEDSIAVLCTTGADIRRIDQALQRLGVPTQVTGAAALLADPAVADVRALLEVAHEPTANPALVRLLSGARWRVGARDLAALGRRAHHLAGGRGHVHTETVEQALEEAVAGSDPVDVVSLAEALVDLGELGSYSQQAVSAFADISSVIGAVRASAGESTVDVVARAMRLLGADIEAALNDPTGGSSAALSDFLLLASAMSEAEGRMGLGGFLARLRDAERFDITISHTRPVRDGAVQLMTVFAAKGLEFGAVFLPFVSQGAFPGGKPRGRWTTGASIVPWPLREDAEPDLATFPDGSGDSLHKQHERYKEATKRLDDRDHERLAYVGLTRAERQLTVTGHWWAFSGEKARGPHRFLMQIKQAVQEADPDRCRVVAWAPEPTPGENNPSVTSDRTAWPQPVDKRVREVLQEAANSVRQAAHREAVFAEPMTVGAEDSTAATWDRRVARWHETFTALVEEDRRHSDERVVRLGPHVGATTFLRALRDPDQLALDVARPMPRQPSRAANRGVTWHAWVETVFGQQALWGVDDLPGAIDAEITNDDQLEELKASFLRSRYAGMRPVAIEKPFSLVIGGRVINGRMDAVFEIDGRYEVVDWKTGGTAVDPRQLAIYRLAWSHIAGVPWVNVDAAFYMVATGEEIRPDTDAEVEALLALD